MLQENSEKTATLPLKCLSEIPEGFSLVLAAVREQTASDAGPELPGSPALTSTRRAHSSLAGAGPNPRSGATDRMT